MIIPLKVLALILSAEFLCHEGNIFTSPRDSGTGPWHVDRATTPPISENARDTLFESVSSSIHTTQQSRVTHTVVKWVLENTRNISAKHFNCGNWENPNTLNQSISVLEVFNVRIVNQTSNFNSRYIIRYTETYLKDSQKSADKELCCFKS